MLALLGRQVLLARVLRGLGWTFIVECAACVCLEGQGLGRSRQSLAEN